MAEFEDLKHNKKGSKYESTKGLPENEIASHAYCDRTAVLGIKVAGKDWPVEFKIEERANFALPPDGPNKNFFLKEVSEEKVVVEYKDQAGAVRSVTIPKHVRDPADSLAKLSYLREESTQWYVVFNMENEGKWKPYFLGRTAAYQTLLHKGRGEPWLSPGDIFFQEGYAAGRFKFLGLADKEVRSARTNLGVTVKVAEYEDLKANKRGFKYVSEYGLPDNEIGAKSYWDRTAVFSLEPGGKDETADFKVEELTYFALPPGAPEKKFFLKEIGREKLVVEYVDQAGAVRSVTIPRRADEATVYRKLDIPKDAAALAVIAQLGNIKLTPKGVDKQSLAEAIRSLSDAGTKDDKATGVINFVIRDTPDGALKVSLPEEETNFAAAVDEACRQAHYRWRIEIAEDSKRALLVLAPPYPAMVRPLTAEQRAVLEQLEAVKLTPKGVRGLELGDALFRLNKQGAKDKATGVINSVTRGSDDHTKITLAEEETNFAAALDLACWQAGFRWTIEAGMDKTTPPLLVLFHKDEKQSGKQGGGGDAALESEETPQRGDSSKPHEDPFGPGD